jgi:hypothetical protein
MFRYLAAALNRKSSQTGESDPYDPKLPLRGPGELTVSDYIKERLNDQLVYYDNTAKREKHAYLRDRVVAVVAGALVPVFVNFTIPVNVPILDIALSQVLATILSVLVVILVSLESVLHHREQWVNSRSTSETLRKEYYLFTTKQGPYVNTNDGDPDGVFRKFVERVESMVEAENISTLQVMTRETQEHTAPSNVPSAGASRQTATPKGDVSDA